MWLRTGMVALIAAVSILGWRHFGNAPVNSRSSAVVTVEIPDRSGVRAVAQQLNDAGLIRSPLGFVLAVTVRGERGRLHAGQYAFSRSESGAEMIRRLVRGDVLPSDVAVTFPEGFTLDQMAARLAANGIADKDAMNAAAHVDRFREEFEFLRDAPAGASLEGYLFPDTYRFRRSTPPDDILRRLLRRFRDQWNTVRSAACQRDQSALCRTPVHGVVTMASILEREVRSTEDRRLVGGILWKRLDTGVGLAADATIRYVTGDWEQPLTDKQLRMDSPYNTRRYRGLPPGPIGNPGRDSLTAALTPTASDYFFYLSASDDGRTIFSRTIEEHNEAKRQHVR